jgi:hypothetical protein
VKAKFIMINDSPAIALTPENNEESVALKLFQGNFETNELWVSEIRRPTRDADNVLPINHEKASMIFRQNKGGS